MQSLKLIVSPGGTDEHGAVHHVPLVEGLDGCNSMRQYLKPFSQLIIIALFSLEDVRIQILILDFPNVCCVSLWAHHLFLPV